MTFAQQIAAVWTGLGADAGEETTLVTEADIQSFLDAWEFEIVKQILLLPRERWADYLNALTSSASNTGNGTTKRWNLPGDMFPGGDYVVTVNSIAATRKDSSYERILSVNSLMASGALDPVYYIFNSQINYGNAPGSGHVAKLYYITNPTGTSGGNTSDLPAKLHQTGVWYALSQAYLIDGDEIQSAQSFKQFLDESRALIQ